MIRPNYVNFKGSHFGVASKEHLEHSAKGTTWEDHKYIKRIDGTYYYPDSYEGGRHLPDSEKEKGKDSDLEDWEKTMYDDIDETLKRNPGLFDPKKIASDDFQDFKVTLSEFAGVDTDKLSKEELERMRKKVQSHYNDTPSSGDLSKNDVENLANEVIRGNFGNGQVRKDLLGENYSEVQKRVNELVAGSSGSTPISEATEESVKKVEETAKKVSSPSSSSSKVHSGVDMDKVLSVYKKKR